MNDDGHLFRLVKISINEDGKQVLNLYLDDLKVKAVFRGQGVGGRLIEACVSEARQAGMRGVYTAGQDNNLSACLFYLKHGFRIGGFDNRCYDGTKLEGNANILFYRECSDELQSQVFSL